MSILRLTERQHSMSSWYHLSVADPTWILRKIPQQAGQMFDESAAIRGRKEDFEATIVERFSVDRQIPVDQARHWAGLPGVPPLSNLAAWTTIRDLAEARFEPGPPPRPRLSTRIKVVWGSVFTAIIAPIVVKFVLHLLRVKD